MHEVYFDRTYIYGVTDVDEGAERNISVYDGLEYGNFPVAENKDLHNWTVQCQLTDFKEPNHSGEWTDARNIFKKLERVLNSKNPKRLIITSDYGKTSKQVLLESYTKSEKGYSGVYDVTLKFVEYKEVGIRTEDVPYIPRPGKVPTPPPVITINSKNGVTPYGVQRKYSTPYSVQSKYTNGMSISQFNQLKYAEPNTGKIFSNPCTIADGMSVQIKKDAGTFKGFNLENLGERLGAEADFAFNRGIKSTFQSMGKAIDEAKNWLAKEFAIGKDLKK